MSRFATALGMLLAASMAAAAPVARTPIRHLVVIFQENHSFDVYFATYPKALNPPGQPAFHARPGTPSVNGLTPTLIERNPNSSKPFRIDRTQSYTCDQDHEYTAEQKARNGGLMDQFVALRRAAAVQRAPVLPQVGGGAVGHGDGLLRRQHRHRATGTTRSTSR